MIALKLKISVHKEPNSTCILTVLFINLFHAIKGPELLLYTVGFYFYLLFFAS